MKHKKYSVSLVYIKVGAIEIETALRVVHLKAFNENEALGIAISDIRNNVPLKTFTLQNKVIKEIK